MMLIRSVKLIFLYINTIKYLKPSQLYYRLFKFTFTNITSYEQPILREPSSTHAPFILKLKSFDGVEKFHFLNIEGELSKVGWHGQEKPLLWRYNQHYFDWLNSSYAKSNKEIFSQAISNWMNACVERSPIAWDPYPTSLRVVNCVKASLDGQVFPEDYLQSLYCQVGLLSRRIERHLLANHLFANAKALAIAGLFFDTKRSEKWLEVGLDILEYELNEQVLDDGGHFELSPMYHAIILEDCLDIYNFLSVYPIGLERSVIIEELLRIKIKQMLSWLKNMSFKNRYSHFNDSVNGVASEINLIFEYAASLGFKVDDTHQCLEELQIKVLEKSGFSVVENKNYKLIFDHGNVGAEYQPGHAHADTLSFECEINDSCLIVNSGVSEYAVSELRSFQRSTAAHSTLNIAGISSSETWSAFRVANRARIVNFEANYGDCSLFASHDGYAKKFNGLIHSRKCNFLRNGFQIEDSLSQDVDGAVIYFYIHPNWNVESTNDGFFCSFKKRVVLISSSNSNAELVKTSYFPEFYKEVPNVRIEIGLTDNMNKTYFTILA